MISVTLNYEWIANKKSPKSTLGGFQECKAFYWRKIARRNCVTPFPSPVRFQTRISPVWSALKRLGGYRISTALSLLQRLMHVSLDRHSSGESGGPRKSSPSNLFLSVFAMSTCVTHDSLDGRTDASIATGLMEYQTRNRFSCKENASVDIKMNARHQDNG